MKKPIQTDSSVSPDTTPSANPWETYWKGTRQCSTYKEGETDSHILTREWKQCFNELAYPTVRMLDIASGYGIVARMATTAFFSRPHEITCVDISESALRAIADKLPSVTTRVCDASRLPFEDCSFNLITSQFGIEYAGEEAFSEAYRVLEPNGTFMVIAHLDGGGIHKECEANYAALEQFRETLFISRSIHLLETKMKRESTQAEIDVALEKAKPAIKATAELIKKYGRNVAGGTLDKIFNDVARISRNAQNFAPEEVFKWLKLMEVEMQAYSQRMKSMCTAAIDDHVADKIKSTAKSKGIIVNKFEKLPFSKGGKNCAWLIHGTKVVRNESI
ncbi:methyltransferase domain-containing protein [Microbulbifer salipaludis]|uniref:Methyltransferase domain-containing protein n=2 Tax=Microbulbifer salipaludis TaxID=187980 RepID=A0ABS3E5R0_9GAMM|nr:methyltransferase domain-containing protein [Microbulbifer salipaludis]